MVGYKHGEHILLDGFGAPPPIRPSRDNLPSVLVIAMEFGGLGLNGYSRMASRDIDVRYLEAFIVEACTVKRV